MTEQRTFPAGLKEIEHLYDIGRNQVRNAKLQTLFS